jgi:hypothetical protein
METWRGGDRNPDGSLTECATQQLRDKVGKIFSNVDVDKKSLLKPLLSNKDHIRAEDVMFTRINERGLTAFVPAQKVGALAITEKRFYVKVSDMPLEMVAASAGREVRSCIVDLTTKTTRLEVLWTEKRPSLFTVTDCGGQAFQGKHCLFKRDQLGLRGDALYDPPHRKVRNVSLAENRSGLRHAKMEWLIVQRFLGGPYGSHANLVMVQEGSKQYFAAFDHTEAIFGACYEIICLAFYKGRLPANFGSDDHMRQVWELTRNNPMIAAASWKSAQGRWFTFGKRTENPFRTTPCCFHPCFSS